MLKIRSLFSGIDAPESALKRLGINYELVDFCEVDKYAIKSYCAIHGADENKNLGDISKALGRDLPYADLLTWGFPCQDISVAGNQAGIKEGETRSGLYYEGFRILKETMPKYSIIENVKNLIGKKFKVDFETMLTDIENLGYNNYWKVLNAKDYGIPQNRERVFIIGIRKDVDNGKFEWPTPFDNRLRLKNMLEDEVDEKYYISQEKIEQLIFQLKDKKVSNTIRTGGRGSIDRHMWDMVCVGNVNPSGNGMNGNVFDSEGLAPTITTNKGEGQKILQIGNISKEILNDNERQRRVYSSEGIAPTILARTDNAKIMQGEYRYSKVIIKEATKKGYAIAEVGDSINIQFPNSKTRRGRVGKEVAQTLETSCNQATLDGYRIRKLTPKECWRLMGFSDEDFQKAQNIGISNTQLYKQAGNSIYVGLLCFLFKNLLGDKYEI